MKDKVSQACDYILDKIENGEYKVDEAIPAARKLTQEGGASFAIVTQSPCCRMPEFCVRSTGRAPWSVKSGRVL